MNNRTMRLDEKEKWLTIKGFEDHYEVSNTGRVRSLDREVAGRVGLVRKIKGQLMKPQKSKKGYLFVGLCIDGEKVLLSLARLVMEAFSDFDRDCSCLVITHINRDKQDCRAVNLAAVGHRETMRSSELKLPRGVRKSGGKYTAHCGIGGKYKHIGHYDSIEEAAKAYKDYFT